DGSAFADQVEERRDVLGFVDVHVIDVAGREEKVGMRVNESGEQGKRGVVDDLGAGADEAIKVVRSLAHAENFAAADGDGAHRRTPLRHGVDRTCANDEVGSSFWSWLRRLTSSRSDNGIDSEKEGEDSPAPRHVHRLLT